MILVLPTGTPTMRAARSLPPIGEQMKSEGRLMQNEEAGGGDDDEDEHLIGRPANSDCLARVGDDRRDSFAMRQRKPACRCS